MNPLNEILSSWNLQPEQALIVLCLSVLLFFLSSGERLKRYRDWLRLIIFVCVFYSVGILVLGELWVVVFIALLLGLGFSMRTLVYDLIAAIWIRLEGRILLYSWIEGRGFSGQVEQFLWRCIVLKDSMGRSVLVPNHHFLVQSCTSSQPGQYRTALRCWIPEDVPLLFIEEKILNWMANV